MTDTAQDFPIRHRTPLMWPTGNNPSRREHEEKRDELAEAKAEFDQQADELQGNLDEINRRWTAQRDQLQESIDELT